MGIKGEKSTVAVEHSAAIVEEKLSVMEGITIKKMFGGRGIFHNDKMFGIIDTKGSVYLKDDASNKAALESQGRAQHSRMPYFKVPDEAVSDGPRFVEMAHYAAELSKQ